VDKRHFVVSSTVQFAASHILPDSAPLLEERGDVAAATLPMNRVYPFGPHRAGKRAGLAAHNDPVNAVEWEVFERPDKRLAGKKANLRGDGSKVSNPANYAGMLNANTHLYMGRPWQRRAEFLQPVAALCEDLKCMLGASFHRGENGADEVFRHIFLKQVAHGVDEDDAGLFPAPGKVNEVVMQGWFKPVLLSLRTQGL
jgi:hypothetical protein